MKIEKLKGSIQISSDLYGLDVISEISQNRYIEFTLIENEIKSSYSLNIEEINKIIKHLEKTKELINKEELKC